MEFSYETVMSTCQDNVFNLINRAMDYFNVLLSSDITVHGIQHHKYRSTHTLNMIDKKNLALLLGFLSCNSEGRKVFNNGGINSDNVYFSIFCKSDMIPELSFSERKELFNKYFLGIYEYILESYSITNHSQITPDKIAFFLYEKGENRSIKEWSILEYIHLRERWTNSRYEGLAFTHSSVVKLKELVYEENGNTLLDINRDLKVYKLGLRKFNIVDLDFSKVIPESNTGNQISEILSFGQDFQMVLRTIINNISKSIENSVSPETITTMNDISKVMKKDQSKVYDFLKISLQRNSSKTRVQEIDEIINRLDDNQRRLLNELQGYEKYIEILEKNYIPGIERMIEAIDFELNNFVSGSNDPQRIETLNRKKEEFRLNIVTANQTIIMIKLTHENSRKQYLKASTISTNLVPLLRVQMAINIGNKTQKESFELQRAIEGAIVGIVEENRQMILENTAVIEEYQPNFGIYQKMSETIDSLGKQYLEMNADKKQKVLLP